MVAPLPLCPLPCCHSIPQSPHSQPPSRAGLASAAGGSGGPAGQHTHACSGMGEKLEVKCLKVRSLFSMNLLYLILSTNSNLIASGLKPLQ